jgi:ligand-binding sensor domain-containing protein
LLRQAGVWGRTIDALAAAQDGAVRIINTSTIRVRQHGACVTRKQRAVDRTVMGRIDQQRFHGLVDVNGLSVQLAVTAAEAHHDRLPPNSCHA